MAETLTQARREVEPETYEPDPERARRMANTVKPAIDDIASYESGENEKIIKDELTRMYGSGGKLHLSSALEKEAGRIRYVEGNIDANEREAGKKYDIEQAYNLLLATPERAQEAITVLTRALQLRDMGLSQETVLQAVAEWNDPVEAQRLRAVATDTIRDNKELRDKLESLEPSVHPGVEVAGERGNN